MKSSRPFTTLLCGADADAMLSDQAFIADWRRLYDASPHATAFQSAGFVTTWYVAYRATWEPVLAVARDEAGTLCALWPLAWSATERTLIHAGDYQAEYHGWLSLAGCTTDFLAAAWRALRQAFPVRQLRCKYLLASEQAEALRAALGELVECRAHPRPLMRLVAEDIRASFAKKSNKSRFNRLKRLGELEFARITDLAELDRVFGRMIEFYDFRQGAINATSPFRKDPLKQAFHRALFTAAPEQVMLTVTRLAGEPLAAYWGAVSGAHSHLGMLAHTPLLAEHSPGKLHIMQLSQHLLDQGLTLLDLTPGGDAWKERFASDHDQVFEAVIHATQDSLGRARAAERGTALAKQALGTLGVSPDRARELLALARRATPAAVLRKARRWVDERREFRVYRCERRLAEQQVQDSRVRRDCLADLLAFEPHEIWQTRQGFLSAALARLEQGHSAWTISLDGRLAHAGWLAAQAESNMSEVEQTLTLPPGSVALYDFYTSPAYRGRGLYRATIAHMLCAAFAEPDTRYAYISVLADNAPSRHVIETLGFTYQGSFHWRCSLGRVSKWADAFAQEAAHA